jgi:hypothetical protein
MDAEAEVDLVAVNTDEETERLRFPGSPTIRADGEGLFPVPERENHAPGCRMYRTPGGLKGWPTAGMIEDALTRRSLRVSGPAEGMVF